MKPTDDSILAETCPRVPPITDVNMESVTAFQIDYFCKTLVLVYLNIDHCPVQEKQSNSLHVCMCCMCLHMFGGHIRFRIEAVWRSGHHHLAQDGHQEKHNDGHQLDKHGESTLRTKHRVHSAQEASLTT